MALVYNRRPRAVSAASAAAALDRFPAASAGETAGTFPLNGNFSLMRPVSVWARAREFLRDSRAAIGRTANRVFSSKLTLTMTALALFLAIVASATVAGSDIDLTRFMPGEANSGRPRIVIVDGRLINQGDAHALNLEITRPRYRLVGDIAPGEAIDPPAGEFAVQYEWRDGENVKREIRTFKTGPDSGRANEPRTAEQRAGNVPRSQANENRTDIYATVSRHSLQRAPNDTGVIPEGLTAGYDPAAHLLTVSAARSIEVRVDGFLLRPVSRTDEAGAEYRYAMANLLVLGQDLKVGETTTFEVVFTKPQDFYSIPIYVREPGKPPVYLTVSVSIKGASL